jgi:Tetratricopeptide repeat
MTILKFNSAFAAQGFGVADLPVTLSNLGSLLCARGKLAQAERHHKRALSLKEKLLGRNHVEVADFEQSRRD